MIAVALALALSAPPPEADQLSLADLPAYRAALAADPAGPAVAVDFRDLWGHPERHRGRRVRVEGRFARRFAQPAVGAFPALTELWVVAPAGDPFCLVFPSPATPTADPGATVRFEGTFLRLIRYRGGDADRLAPLIVGRGPPAASEAGRPHAGRGPGQARLDWAVGLGLAAVVTLVLVVQHARRPVARRAGAGPAPIFEDER